MAERSMTAASELEEQFQDLSKFKFPAGFRGRSAAMVQLWWAIDSVLFRTSPQVLYGWRRFLLRLFGARIGRQVKIRPSVTVTYPWKVQIGDYSWIGDGVDLYSLAEIRIGCHTVVSQGCYICAGTHNRKDVAFPIEAMPIEIEDQVWIASQVFIGPGVRVGRGAVVGMRSLVLKDIPPGVFACGHPARVRGERK
jgi:putative colanic acid biosynthesis acetyltransferase WcaF